MNTARKLLSPWKITFLSSVGGMLEFYDFVIFAVFALPIGQAVVPPLDKRQFCVVFWFNSNCCFSKMAGGL